MKMKDSITKNTSKQPKGLEKPQPFLQCLSSWNSQHIALVFFSSSSPDQLKWHSSVHTFFTIPLMKAKAGATEPRKTKASPDSCPVSTYLWSFKQFHSTRRKVWCRPAIPWVALTQNRASKGLVSLLKGEGGNLDLRFRKILSRLEIQVRNKENLSLISGLSNRRMKVFQNQANICTNKVPVADQRNHSTQIQLSEPVSLLQ